MINLRINYDQNKYAKIEQGIRQMYSNHPDPSSAEAAFSVAGLIADAFPYISPAEAMRNSNTIIKQYTGHDLDPVGAWQEFGKTFKAQASDLASSMKMAKNMIEFSKSKDQEAFTKMRDEYLEEMRNNVPSYRNDFKKMSFVTDLLIESGRIIPSQIPSMGIYIAGSLLAPATMGASLAFSRGAGALYSGMMEAGGLVKELLLVEDELGNTLSNDLIMSAFILTLGGVSALNLVGDRFSKGVANSVTKLFGKKNISSAIKSGAVRSVATKILLNKLEGIGSEAVEESLEELIGMLATNYVMDKSNKDSDTLFEGHSKDDIIKAMVEVGISTAKGMVFAGLPGDAMQAINEYTSNDTNLKREANKVSPYTTDSYAIDMANIVKPKAKYDSKVDKADAPVNLVQVAGVYKAADDTSSHVIYSLKENGAKAVNANIIENTSTPTETSKTVAYNISRNTGVPIKDGKLLFNNQQEMESFTESIARDNDKFVGYHPEEGKVTLDYKDETGLHAIEFLVDETVKSRKEVLEAERDNKPMQTKMDGSEQDLDSQMKLLEREFTSKDAPNPDKLDRKFYRPYFKALKDKGATDSDISFLHSKVLPQIYDTVKQQNPKLSSVQVYHQALPSSYLMFLASRVAGMDTESFYNQTFAETGFGVLTEASQKAFLRSSQGHQSAEVELGKGTTENVVVNGLLWTDKNGKRIIGLGEGATPLTIAHELGHVILDSIKGTESFNDFAQLYADEIAKDNGLIGRYTNERFAHDLETYLQTGVARDQATRTIFAKIAQAIKDFIGFIRGELDPEVAKAFDDLFDTDKRSEYTQEGKVGTDKTIHASLTEEAASEMEDLRKQYEGTSQWLKAPNGKDSNLNAFQWLQVRTKAFKAWYGDWENDPENSSLILDENGEPLQVYHGTLFTFDRFDRNKAEGYGDLGAGFYFTNTPADADSNYASKEGGDINAKVVTIAIELAKGTGKNFNDPEIMKEAWKVFGADHEGVVIPAYLNMRNPVFLDDYYDTKKTFLNVDAEERWERYKAEAKELLIDQYGDDIHLTEDVIESAALTQAFNDEDPSDVVKIYRFIKDQDYNGANIGELAWDLEGFIKHKSSASRLIQRLKNGGGIRDVVDDRWLPMAGEVIRLAFERLGYDGFVDPTVSDKFRMPGMEKLTTHFIVFNDVDVKSSIGNIGTFSKSDPALLASLSERNDIREKYKNTPQWLKAPNGKDTDLPPGSWLDVRTEGFKNYFGDWENDPENSSKVVDWNGEPKIVYHSTFFEFDYFDPEAAGVYGDMGAGFYFSNNPNESGENYGTDTEYYKIIGMAWDIERELGLKKGDPIAIQLAWERLNPDHKGATIPVYLNFRNPVFLGNYYKNKKTILNIDGRARWDKYIKMAEDFIYSKYGEDAHIDMIEEKAMEYGLNDENPSDLAKIYQFIKNGGFEFLDEDVLFKELGQFLPYPASAEDVMAALKDGTALFDVWDSDGSWIGNEIVRQAFEYLGYDGVIDTTVYEKLGMPGMDFNTVHYIAFNNTDIKSAIGNSGKFDKTNPAIRASISKKIDLESLKESLAEGKYPTDDELNLHKGDPDVDWEIQFRRIISQDQELVDLFVSSYVDTEWDSEEGVSAEAILKTLKERTDEPLYESILGEVGDPERFIKRLIQEYNYKSPEAATAKFLRDIADRKFLIEVSRALTKDSDITNSYWEDDVRIMKLGQAKDDEITYYKVREARSAIRQDPNHYRVKYLTATGQEAQLSFERAGVEEAKSFANRPTNFKNEEITRLLNDKNTDPELVNLIRQNLANGETISALVEHTNNSITKLTQEFEESLQAAGLDKEALLDKMAELDVANATLEQLETKYHNLQDINEANYESMRRYRRLYETKVKQLQYVKAKRIIERANRNIKTAINSQARSNDARIMDNLKKIVTVMYESGGEDLTPKLDMLGLDIKSIPQLASFFVVTEDGIFTENPLKSMDVVKVGNLYNAVKSVVVDAKNEKALRDAIKKQETLNIVNQYVAQIGSDKNIESFKDVHEFTKELKMDGHIRGAVDSKAAGQKGRAKAFLDTKLLTMSRIIKKIDGDKGNVLEAYLLGGRDNEGTLHLGIEGVIDAEKRAEFERYGAGKEMLQKLGITEKDLIRKHINVRGVELSLDEAIGVYVYSQQAEGKSKLLSENGNRFTQSDIDKVIDSLSDNHKLWGDWMISDMMGKYDEIADVFYNVNNQILGKIAKYFPLVREGKNESFSDLMQDSYLNMQENPDDTPTHRRTGADYKLQLNATTIWSQMVRKQEHYIAGAEFFNNANFLMRQSGGDLYNMIAFRAGETYANSLQDFINRVARKRYAIDDMDGILNTVRNNLIVARLGFNILTVFKQIPSLGYFAMEYGPVRLMEAISHMVMDYKGTTEFIYERAPQLRSRSSSIDFSSVMEMHPKNEYQRVVKKIGEIGMSPIQFVDGLVVKTLWYGAYQNNIANGMIETEAAMNATKFINDTQPGGLAKDTAAIYHTNSTLMKFLTMFSSQLNKNLNIAHDIPYAIKNRMYSQAFKNMIGLGLSFAGIMFIQGGYKDSDDDDKIIDDMFRSLSSQLAAMIPIFGSDISSIINGNYYSDNGLPLMSETFSLVSAIGSDREDKIERIINNSVRFGLGAMETSGAPAGQARKIYETFTRDDEINLWYLLGHGFGD